MDVFTASFDGHPGAEFRSTLGISFNVAQKSIAVGANGFAPTAELRSVGDKLLLLRNVHPSSQLIDNPYPNLLSQEER